MIPCPNFFWGVARKANGLKGEGPISYSHKPNEELPRPKIQNPTMNKTYVPPINSLEHKWYVIDAEGQRLGRLASAIAQIIRGKNKANFTPHLDTGDFVIVINAEKIEVTGKKSSQKLYRRHSGRPGGMKTETFAKLQARLPERIIEEAVKGMLPKTSLGRKLFTKLKVYVGPNHPHEAQLPEELTINTIPGGNN